jgi:hypothetical protein
LGHLFLQKIQFIIIKYLKKMIDKRYKK